MYTSLRISNFSVKSCKVGHLSRRYFHPATTATETLPGWALQAACSRDLRLTGITLALNFFHHSLMYHKHVVPLVFATCTNNTKVRRACFACGPFTSLCGRICNGFVSLKFGSTPFPPATMVGIYLLTTST